MADLAALFLNTRHCDWIAMGMKSRSTGRPLKRKFWFCKTCREMRFRLNGHGACPLDAATPATSEQEDR